MVLSFSSQCANEEYLSSILWQSLAPFNLVRSRFLQRIDWPYLPVHNADVPASLCGYNDNLRDADVSRSVGLCIWDH